MGKSWNPLGFLRRKQRFMVREDERERDDQIYYAMAGTKRHAHRTWYRGEHTLAGAGDVRIELRVTSEDLVSFTMQDLGHFGSKAAAERGDVGFAVDERTIR